MRLRLPLLVAGVLWASAGAALATPITVTFSGTIDTLDDAGGVLDGSIAAGVPFTGTATWDDAATDRAPADPTSGDYRDFAPPWNFVLQVGNYTFEPGPFRLEAHVLDRTSANAEPDVFRVVSQSATVNGTPSSGSFTAVPSFALESAGNTVLTSDALTDVPLSLAAWDFANLEVFILHDDIGGSTFAFFGGAIDQLVVPEPATAAVLSLGLALLGARRVSAPRRRG